jgi:hypothetical protein
MSPTRLALALSLVAPLAASSHALGPAPTPILDPGGAGGPARLSQPVSHDLSTGVTTWHSAVQVPAGFPGSASSPGSGGPSGWEDAVLLGPQDASNPDWSPNCRVLTIFQDGSTRESSGTLIDPRVVITSGSAVHEGPGGTWAQSVIVTPGWDGDDDLTGESYSFLLYAWPQWFEQGQEAFNQGYLYLQRPVGHLAGWHGYYTDSDDAQVLATPYLLGAYPTLPCFAGAPDQLHSSLGLWNDVQPNLLVSDTDWPCEIDGMDGAGAIRSVGNGIEVGAVLVGGTGAPGTTTQIQASRIDDVRFTYLHDTLIPSLHVAGAVDLTPMKCRTDTVYAAQGSSLTLTFSVANESTFDPPLDEYGFSVYLSSFPQGATLGDFTFTWDFEPLSITEVSVSAVVPLDLEPGDYSLGVYVEPDAGIHVNANATSGWDTDLVRVIDPSPFEDLGCALAGVNGDPILTTSGDMTYQSFNLVGLENAAPLATAGLFLSTAESAVAFKGGVLKAVQVPEPYLPFVLQTSALGTIDIFYQFTVAVPFGTELFMQWAVSDPAAIHGVALSNAVRAWTQ